MKGSYSPLKWRHLEPVVILMCSRCCRRYQLSYRDLEEMMLERDLSVDHVAIFRRVHIYAPEITKSPWNAAHSGAWGSEQP